MCIRDRFVNMRRATRERLAAFYGLESDDLRTPVEDSMDEQAITEQLAEVIRRLQRIELAIGAGEPEGDSEEAARDVAVVASRLAASDASHRKPARARRETRQAGSQRNHA